MIGEKSCWSINQMVLKLDAAEISVIPEEIDENCLNTISNILREKLEINPCPSVPQSHRLRQWRHGALRLDIVYCLGFRDAEHYLSNARKLRGTHVHINRDYPRDIVDARK
ncbi:hypothetical protein DPMN_030776 [Dreissena polymorpha]|uniref:Uncharacterized protein n=1 Tax=Dreissena polymorpha TaxID=45954 RepID=A0A9D4RGP5_DREPO|nr:hypothetical protein DPMN_030776 [Dreissena polymorpha]